MTEKNIDIQGMSCGHCVMAVRRELAKIPGVEVKTIAVGSATVIFDEHAVPLDRIYRAIREAGYVPAG
jgi:copper chaperone